MELFQELWQLLLQFIDVMLHLDVHLNEWMGMFGVWMYMILFLVIFCETGLVVTPFLPGDSLLFALGALCVGPSAALNVWVLWIVLIVAAILGDGVNYFIGKKIGPKIFRSESSRFLNKQHLARTQVFYEKYGGKTIIFARFLPIFRTFAPFVAGIGSMCYRRFSAFNVVGAFFWITTFLFAGYYFGNLPVIKSNFHYVIFAIIIISALPAVIEFLRHRYGAKPASESIQQ